MTVRPGMILQERYEILEIIGSGGMSVVFKALCHKLNRPVAIKVLKEEFSSDQNFVDKFRMEAQAVARLSHPNIVNVYDVVDEDSLHYIVMELIEGITLKNYIAKKVRLDAREAIGVSIQVAQGIAAAHEQHIVHRDIKPQNIMISKDGKVKVADFGIARAVSAQTLSSAAMGSVHYISPEQARGGYIDARSDIYSLGITIYEMVTGRVPYDGENTVTVALAHLENPIVAPGVYAPEIPEGLEEIILKCTEKSPDRRYDRVSDLIEDLRIVLLHPHEHVAPRSPSCYSDNTIAINPVDMVKIRESRRSGGQGGSVRKDRPYQDGRGEYKPQPRQTSHPRKGGNRASGHDDIDPKMERLMSVIGVLLALVIVGVLLFTVSRLTGIFSPGGSKTNDTSQSGDESSTEQTLSEKQVLMPGVLGLDEEIARKKLSDYDLQMKFTDPGYSDVYEKGQVMAQETPEGTVVDRYSTVYVTISQGPQNPEIDLNALGLLHLEEAAAKALLEGKKFTVATESKNDNEVPVGQVTGFSPEKARAGDRVTLYISSGPALNNPVSMPVLEGQTEVIALGMISGAGLVLGEVTEEPSDTAPSGTIIKQEIPAGTQIESGTAVNYTVSSGPEQQPFKYLASIEKSYALQNMVGPGAPSMNFKIKVRLMQVVGGEEQYRDLIAPVTMTGDQILPISFTNIEGAYGVTSGEVQVVNVDTGEVLKSYSLTFIPVPQS